MNVMIIDVDQQVVNYPLVRALEMFIQENSNASGAKGEQIVQLRALLNQVNRNVNYDESISGPYNEAFAKHLKAIHLDAQVNDFGEVTVKSTVVTKSFGADEIARMKTELAKFKTFAKGLRLPTKKEGVEFAGEVKGAVGAKLGETQESITAQLARTRKQLEEARAKLKEQRAKSSGRIGNEFEVEEEQEPRRRTSEVLEDDEKKSFIRRASEVRQGAAESIRGGLGTAKTALEAQVVKLEAEVARLQAKAAEKAPGTIGAMQRAKSWTVEQANKAKDFTMDEARQGQKWAGKQAGNAQQWAGQKAEQAKAAMPKTMPMPSFGGKKGAAGSQSSGQHGTQQEERKSGGSRPSSGSHDSDFKVL